MFARLEEPSSEVPGIGFAVVILIIDRLLPDVDVEGHAEPRSPEPGDEEPVLVGTH